MINHPDVLSLFARQHWVASIDQLFHDHQVSIEAVKWARRRGTVTSLLPGIVSLTGAPVTFESQATALQLYLGETSYLSGMSAGVLHGLRGMPRSPIEFAVRLRKKRRVPPWGRVVWLSWALYGRDYVERPDGLRVATPLHTLFRLAGTFNQHRFERAAEDCWHRRLLTPDDAATYLAEMRRSGRTGVLRFGTWLDTAAARARPSQSGLELDVLDAIRRAGLPEPERQFQLVLPSGEPIHIDLAWPDVRLGLEPGHSWWHGGDLRQRADQARDRSCVEIGWLIVRCDESIRNELAAFGRQLRTIHDERRRSLRKP